MVTDGEICLIGRDKRAGVREDLGKELPECHCSVAFRVVIGEQPITQISGISTQGVHEITYCLTSVQHFSSVSI